MDAITHWNDAVQEADRVTHTTGDPREGGSRGPAGSSRAYAMVHLAMHDAYFSVKQPPAAHGTYLAGLPPAPAGASDEAAIAAAAHATLSALYPAQKAYFDAHHAAAGLSGAGLYDGHAQGLAVAGAILAARKDDPTTSDDGHGASMARGAHRPDPENPAQGYHAPNYGARAACFAVNARHTLDAPPQIGTLEYNDALVEVRAKGIRPELLGTIPPGDGRTPEETVIGLFWAYDGAKGLGTPPRLYNQIIRQIADDQANTLEQNARLFALVNAAMGDAGILAWDDKYRHDLWRPVVGIREHDPSMGPTGVAGNVLDADCDPSWLPLGAPKTNDPDMMKNFTPPFPAYPSGHATFGAAALHSTRRYYEVEEAGPDNLADGLSFVSEELNGANTDNLGTVRPRHVREFPDGLWQMMEENGRSRVYLGVHWVFDAFVRDPDTGGMDVSQNVGGVPLGLAIANDLAANGLVQANAAGPRIV